MFCAKCTWILGSTSSSKLSHMVVGTTHYASHVCIVVSDSWCLCQTKTARQRAVCSAGLLYVSGPSPKT